MMKSKLAATTRVMLLALAALIGQALPGQESNRLPASQAVATPQVSLPSAAGQESIRLFEGKSLVISTPEPVKRVSVTNDQIATAIVVSPTQILIHGIKAGTVTLVLWNEQEEMRSFDLSVLQTILDLQPLRATLSSLLPGQDIKVAQSGTAIILTGTVSSPAVADQAVSVAKTDVPNVVSLLTVATPPAPPVVLLQVNIAEVERNAVQQLGVNILSTGALNTPGVISTQQFAPPSTNSINAGPGIRPTNNFTLTDLLNIFVFRPDLNLALMIKALQQKSLLETLAEPNLLAVAGKEASFLAGGEFPVPIVQGSGGAPIVSVQFKEFGVRLKFLADPRPDGIIHLKVNPEVSSLDFANGVTVSGFLIPALTTRRAETEVELRDGQSFAIAGLLDNRVTRTDNKIPWLGDVPILGNLFKSRNFTKGNTELLVMVTPHLVKPLEPGQVPSQLPTFPVPFLGKEGFDGNTGDTSMQKQHPPG